MYILTGPVHSGKTTLLKNILSSLEEKDLSIDGYLSEANWKGEEFIGYDLYDLRNRQYFPFIRKKGQEDWQRIGSFYFLPETLDRAQRIIHRCKNTDLCIVDEVGPLELKEKGVWPALKDVLKIPEQNMLLVLRKSILKDFMRKMQRDDLVLFDIDKNKTPALLAESLLRNIEKKRESVSK